MNVYIVYSLTHMYGAYSTLPKALIRVEVLTREGIFAEILETSLNEGYDDEASNKK